MAYARLLFMLGTQIKWVFNTEKPAHAVAWVSVAKAPTNKAVRSPQHIGFRAST